MSTLILALFAALGFFLLIAGVQLVGLIAAFTGGVLGWCLGGFIHDSIVPEWSPAICAATASVGCAALAALFVRPAVAVGFAAAGTIIGLLFAGLLVERGIAPTAPLPSAKSSTNATQEVTPSASVRAARSGLTDSILSIVGESRHQSAGEDTNGSIARLAGAGGRIAAQIKSRWDLVPPATQTFLFAVTAGGAVMGFGLGIFFARWALAGAAATLGSLLFLGCGMPLMETIVPSFHCPDSPTAWIFLGGATTLAGWAFQMRRVQAQKEAPSPA